MTPVIEQDPDHVEAEETSDDAPLTKGDLKDMFNSLREDVTKEVEDHMKETVEVAVEKTIRHNKRLYFKKIEDEEPAEKEVEIKKVPDDDFDG